MKEIVSLSNVTVQRGGNILVKDVSWQIQRGEHWGLLGRNGCGKTTLLKVLSGSMWPKAGSGPVDILGNRYGRAYMPDVKKSIGWVSQALERQYQNYPHADGLEIVLSGLHASIGLYEPVTQQEMDRAYQLLEQFGAGHLAETPQQHFSQGELKKVLLARAWMAEPALLILDEPCSGLDLAAREELLSRLEQSLQQGGPTLIYVTHHMEELIAPITHAALMKDGSFISQGEKETVLNEKEASAAFDVPVSVSWEHGRPWVKVKPLL
ncbi:ABC transporter ATP-binding protein [Alkalicoccus luteus]|uniref:ABC transporter ATP-binding protein n=1 Tax=Alkalicoccus luteus TaxID=1237094 RepID=UPI0040344C3D